MGRRVWWGWLWALAAVWAAVAVAPAGEGAVMVTVLRVVDGDSLVVWDADVGEVSARLLGVDAPEAGDGDKAARTAAAWGVSVREVVAAGRAARDYVAGLAPPGSVVRMAAGGRGRDDYGRALVYLYTPDGQCLNEVLVRNGYARAFRRERFRMRGRYLELEAEARRGRRGFWRTVWRHVED